MEVKDNEKPCKVCSEQGFFVNYKNRSLYSKYNPSKNILTLINSLNLLPGTLVLAVSPVLDYGLKELEEKLPKDSFVFAVEMEDALEDFITSEGTLNNLSKTILIPRSSVYNLPKIIHQPAWAGMFRRVISINFSAGSAFHKNFYDSLNESMVLSIKQYWANRVTLQKFGKKWHKNLFENLKILENTVPIENYLGNIEKPIVVAGAGKSAKEAIPFIKNNRHNLFVLCVDTSFPLLISSGISPDGIVLEEAQNAIRESFIGHEKSDSVVFASLSSVPHPVKKTEKICYFATRFQESSFWENLSKEKGFPYEIPPFGSVGLSAIKLALAFRKNNSIPVLLYGLDFSFEAGTTHALGTSAHKRLLRSAGKNKSFENYSCYSPYTLSLSDKNGLRTFTLPVMKTYRDLLEDSFSKEENLWDCGKSGLSLGLPFISYEDAVKLCKNTTEEGAKSPSQKTSCASFKTFLETEKEALLELRKILSGETDLLPEERSQKISTLLEKREYLYVHFPDGYRFSMELNYLKRIRVEIDCFLKVLCRN